MKKSTKKRSRRQGIKSTQLKREIKRNKPAGIKPILYTRRLKSRKQRKIKEVDPQLWSNALDSGLDDDPLSDDEQRPPSSFLEMIGRINEKKSDTGNMLKKPDVIPKQGENETPESYARRLDSCVQDELMRIAIEKADKAPLVDPETYKSEKARRALKRLAMKKARKKAFRMEKHLTGFEHLKDEVAFNEVVQGPPVLTTKPKKVGGGSRSFVAIKLHYVVTVLFCQGVVVGGLLSRVLFALLQWCPDNVFSLNAIFTMDPDALKLLEPIGACEQLSGLMVTEVGGRPRAVSKTVPNRSDELSSALVFP
ncbi:unnamed protein product [Hydatigera taeniaeformis]|uniref:Ribosome biogenesis protein NOP53 n=1 Tax=Hydatigena taeniaeformis TaxID=6205 RepID=A0A158REX8_HYDTA|nr:unnamed protein product [Hydatigera taeniaeformis]